MILYLISLRGGETVEAFDSRGFGQLAADFLRAKTGTVETEDPAVILALKAGYFILDQSMVKIAAVESIAVDLDPEEVEDDGDGGTPVEVEEEEAGEDGFWEPKAA